MDSKTLILTILIVSTISVILVTMTSFEQIANAATISTTTKSGSATTPNGNDINCQSKTGTANTANLGTLKLGGAKCTGENGGTVAAGGVKSNAGAIGVHGIQGPNGNSHVGGFIKR